MAASPKLAGQKKEGPREFFCSFPFFPVAAGGVPGSLKINFAVIIKAREFLIVFLTIRFLRRICWCLRNFSSSYFFAQILFVLTARGLIEYGTVNNRGERNPIVCARRKEKERVWTSLRSFFYLWYTFHFPLSSRALHKAVKLLRGALSLSLCCLLCLLFPFFPSQLIFCGEKTSHKRILGNCTVYRKIPMLSCQLKRQIFFAFYEVQLTLVIK